MRQREGRDDAEKNHKYVGLRIRDIGATTRRADRAGRLDDAWRSVGHAAEQVATARGVPDDQRGDDERGDRSAGHGEPTPVESERDQRRANAQHDKTDTEHERSRERLPITRQSGRAVVPVESERAVADANREEIKRDREETRLTRNAFRGLSLALPHRLTV